MRISNASQSRRVGLKTASLRGGGAQPAFSTGEPSHPQDAAPMRGGQAIQGIDALIVIQGVGDAVSERRRAVRRGHCMLDALEAIRIDLLGGEVPAPRLRQLLRMVDERMPDTGDPRIAEVLAEIELRARVELAKHGHL